jgi:hypothetical protein
MDVEKLMTLALVNFREGVQERAGMKTLSTFHPHCSEGSTAVAAGCRPGLKSGWFFSLFSAINFG